MNESAPLPSEIVLILTLPKCDTGKTGQGKNWQKLFLDN